MEKSYYWDGQIDYLRKSESLYYNDDYLEFLVQRVWGWDRPVRVVDYGCGFGHLGLRLLPLLPAGSSYTGIDAGTRLIEHAEELFAKLPYQTKFVCGDIHHVTLTENFDVALCHAVLLHMEEPLVTLQRMINSVTKGGTIIAFEPHWMANQASYHVEGLDQSEVIPLGQLQELFERDAKRSGKDGNIGIKLPLYFRQLGLSDIQCRMSDKVTVYDPSAPDAADLYAALRFDAPGERDKFIPNLLARGMSLEEAVRQYNSEQKLAEQFTASTPAVYAAGMKITFGTV